MENTINRLAVAADAFSKLPIDVQDKILELMRSLAQANQQK